MESDKISIHRIGLLYRFYSPAIRILLIISGAVLLGAYALSLYGVVMTRQYSGEGPFVLIYSMGAGIAAWVYVAGPFILPMVSNRALITTLPASWAEKALFLFSWIFVLYPLYLFVLWYGATGVSSLFTDTASVNTAMMAYISDMTEGLNLNYVLQKSRIFSVLSDMALVSVAALVIVSVRRNRFVLGIVGLIVCSFVSWLIGVIIGIISIVKSDFVQQAAAGNVEPVAPQEIIDVIAGYMPYVGLFSGLVIVACVVLIVRKIKYRQC